MQIKHKRDTRENELRILRGEKDSKHSADAGRPRNVGQVMRRAKFEIRRCGSGDPDEVTIMGVTVRLLACSQCKHLGRSIGV